MTQRKRLRQHSGKGFAPPRHGTRLRADTCLEGNTLVVVENIDIWQSEDEPRLVAVLAECWDLLTDGAAQTRQEELAARLTELKVAMASADAKRAAARDALAEARRQHDQAQQDLTTTSQQMAMSPR